MRGTLAVITAALVTLLALTSLLAYVSVELHRLPQQYSRYGYDVQRYVASSSKDLSVSVTSDGLILKTSSPPVTVNAILIITPSGINISLGGMVVNTPSAKLLDHSVVSNVLDSGGYIVVVTEGRRYLIVDRSLLASPPSTSAGSAVSSLGDSLSLRLSHIRPMLYAGILLRDSFVDNPIPGLPSDPEANYLPVGYAMINANSHTLSRGDWYLYVDPRSNPNKLGITYGSGSTSLTYLGMGYYRLDSQHRVYVRWYELVSGYDRGWYISTETVASGTACMYVYPFVVSGGSSFNLVYYLENLDGHISLSLRPFVYVVHAEDAIRGSLLPPASMDLVPEPAIRYPVARPLYVWEGSRVTAYMRAGDHVSVIVPVNAASTLGSLGVNRAIVLAGIRFSTSSALSIKLTTFITDYSMQFAVTSSEVGKHVVVPSSSNVVPELITPSGLVLPAYRPSNVISSVVRYPVLFMPTEPGTYTLRYRLGNYHSIPELRVAVSLPGSRSAPQVVHLRNQHLGWVSYVVEDWVALEPSHATLRDHEYLVAGSEAWYSGDLVTIAGVPPSGTYNLSYYVTGLVQGVRTLSVGQNTTLDLYHCWRPWDCAYYWRIHVVFLPGVSNYTMRVYGDVLYPSGSYYLRFETRIVLANAQVNANPSVSGIKYAYGSGGNTYLLYVASTHAELARLNSLITLT